MRDHSLLSKFRLASRRRSPHYRRCNLCHDEFRAVSRFHRFCERCKESDELLRFHEWIPAVSS